ncbi:MAG: hypothetical protein Fur005_18830 [Roseiflexaceae bacterium]
MPQSYQLAQTYAPVDDFEQQLAALDLSPDQFCQAIGIARITYDRICRNRVASRQTAILVAAGFALAHGSISPVAAMQRLFVPRPRVVMEEVDVQNGQRRFRRRGASGGSGSIAAYTG